MSVACSVFKIIGKWSLFMGSWCVVQINFEASLGEHMVKSIRVKLPVFVEYVGSPLLSNDTH